MTGRNPSAPPGPDDDPKDRIVYQVLDEMGDPICPACGDSVVRGAPALLSSDRVIHKPCRAQWKKLLTMRRRLLN